MVTPFLIVAMLGLNLYVALIAGWLFWQYGLWAAVASHMILHLIWYPFDRRLAAR
jgi:tellurite resistance protein TehA-like permease